jgi:hypothetical protein
MWKQAPESTSGQRSRRATPQSSAPSSGSDIGESSRVRVRIIRPDGSYRDVTVAGHFREEHLCSLVDDELCHLGTGETLTVHLFHPDGNLTHSLRSRWQEGLSDNRQVFMREVLGPNVDARELAVQLRQIRQRMASGEKVNLAIRSSRVAQAACEELRKLLLISQRFDEALLNVWVHGNEDQQRAIVGQLEGAGMVRLQDYEQFVSKHHERRWKGPWLDFELAHPAKKFKKRSHAQVSSDESVSRWIKRVEEDREHPQH